MTNLSDLFPAGAGKQVSFTASGNVTSSGKPVVLNSDGTVSEVGPSAGNPGKGSLVVYDTDSTASTSVCYDSNANKVVIAWQDSNDTYGYAVVGTVSGTSISFGTPVAFNIAITESISTAYDSDTNQVIVAYYSDNTKGVVRLGTVSGTSISFGADTYFNLATTTSITAGYDPNVSKVLIAFRDDGNSDYGTLIVGTVSGTSISFGSEHVFQTGQTSDHSLVYDVNATKMLLTYRHDASSGNGTANVCTISGTSVSTGSDQVFLTGSTLYVKSTYDSTAQKVVVGFSDGSNSWYGTAIVGTISGTSVSFGTKAAFTAISATVTSANYDDNNNTTVISYTAGTSPFNALVVNGTVSGTSISFSSAFTLTTGQTDQFFAGAYDTSSNNTIFGFRHVADSSAGTSIVYTNAGTNLTSTNFLGISDAAFSSAASGNITIKGGIAATGLSSLTPASDYYVQDDGTITTVSSSVKAGKALSATAINLEYTS
jgi:hypothetical protein